MVPASLSGGGGGVFVAVVTTCLSSSDRQLAWRRIVVDESLVSRADVTADCRCRRRRCSRRRIPSRSPIVCGDRGRPSRSQPIQATGHRFGVPDWNDVVAARRQAFEDAHAPPSAAASRQEAAERVYAVHEGDAIKGDRRMHIEGVGRHQPNSRQKGLSDIHYLLYFFIHCFLLAVGYSLVGP